MGAKEIRCILSEYRFIVSNSVEWVFGSASKYFDFEESFLPSNLPQMTYGYKR